MNLSQAISISIALGFITIFAVRLVLRFLAYEKQGWPTDGKSPQEIAKMTDFAKTVGGFLKGSPERSRSILRLEKALADLAPSSGKC